jgi:DHA2 family multidrug resistance protein-like MFS transporter
MVSGSIGVAIIGSILSTVYASSFKEAASTISMLPAELVGTASDSVGVAVTVAAQLPPEVGDVITGIARQSFMDGWQVTALVTCGISIVGALTMLKFMPAKQED